MNYMDLVNLHVSCAIKNCEYFEYFVPEENYTCLLYTSRCV